MARSSVEGPKRPRGETRATDLWRNVSARDISLPLAKSLQRRGVAGISISKLAFSEIRETGIFPPKDFAIFVSPAARRVLNSILKSPEMQALQRASNPEFWRHGEPDFAGMTTPALQTEETQRRLTALYWNGYAEHVYRWAIDSFGGSTRSWSKKLIHALASRHKLLNDGKLTLPTQDEIGGWVEEVVDAKYPQPTPATAAPATAA